MILCVLGIVVLLMNFVALTPWPIDNTLLVNSSALGDIDKSLREQRKHNINHPLRGRGRRRHLDGVKETATTTMTGDVSEIVIVEGDTKEPKTFYYHSRFAGFADSYRLLPDRETAKWLVYNSDTVNIVSETTITE